MTHNYPLLTLPDAVGQDTAAVLPGVRSQLARKWRKSHTGRGRTRRCETARTGEAKARRGK